MARLITQKIYETYKDLYLSKKEHEDKLLQGIQSASGLKSRVGAKKSDGTALVVTTQENAIKKTFDKRFAIPLDFYFFKHAVYPYGLKEDLIVRLELNSSENSSLQGLLLVFLDKRDEFASKNEEFYIPSIKKILVTINGMLHQLFSAGLQAREIYPELKKYFYKESFDVTWKDFLTTKFALWIDARSSIDNTLHGSGRAVEKSGILVQIEKATETSGDLTCQVFSLEDAVTHLSVTNPSGILTIEK